MNLFWQNLEESVVLDSLEKAYFLRYHCNFEYWQ
jgi:hypothetical protein